MLGVDDRLITPDTMKWVKVGLVAGRKSIGVVKAGEGGKLEFDEVLMRVAADAQLVLSEQIRHSILQVTQV